MRVVPYLMACVRLCAGLTWWYAVPGPGWVVCVCEAWAALLGCINARRSFRIGTDLQAAVVVVAYAMGLSMVPGLDRAGLWGIACVQVAGALLRVNLGCAFSVGGPTWVGLVDSGAYAWVRHPLSANTLVNGALVLAMWPTAWNVGAGVVLLLAVLAEIKAEERALSTVWAWRDYASRVAWRLVPGVW